MIKRMVNGWFFLSNLEWNMMESLAHEKKRLIEVYSEHSRRFETISVQYKDYSEYLVEQFIEKHQIKNRIV